MKETEDVGILIASCDNYSDLWLPFFSFWHKYWHDCCLPVYLMTNTREYPSVKQIFVNGNTWSDEMKHALQQFPHEYLLYFQDDYFLTKKVDNNHILKLISVLSQESPGYLRVYPHPGERVVTEHPRISTVDIITKGTPYSTSLQVAFWKVEIFEKLLLSGESNWKFEFNAPARSLHILDDFLSVKRSKDNVVGSYAINYFCTAIRKGKWRTDAIDLCRKENIPIVPGRLIEKWDDILVKKIIDKIPLKLKSKLIK